MQRYLAKSGIRLLVAMAVVFWVEVLAPQAVRASDLQGMGDPALQAAIDTWLKDNDADSLSVFASLAAAGNVAARLLLARIEITDQGPSDFVNGLSRKQRVELFRSSLGAGLFRPSWLKSEKAAGNQFASALLDSTNTVVDIGAIRKLYELGEPEAAYGLIREAAGNGSEQQKQELADFLPPDSELMPYLRALRNPLAAVTPGHAALQLATDIDASKAPQDDTRAAANFVEYGYQTGVQTSDFDRSNAYYDDLASWIESAPATAPIAALCRQTCADETRACAITVFGLVGGYYKAIKFDSPMQTLIEQSRFVTSARAPGMVLRRVSFARSAGASQKLLISDGELMDRSACLAQAVAEARAHRH
jgi:hypothetical protein